MILRNTIFITTVIAGTAAQAAGPIPTPIEPAVTTPSWTPEPAPEWEVMLGGGAIYEPDYEGSDEMELKPLPFISLGYGRFSIGPDKIGVSAWEGERASLGLSLGYGGGRDPDDIDSGALDGFAEIDDAALLGLEFDYDLGSVKTFVGIERYLGESDGTSLELGLRRETMVSERLMFSASASATVSDSNYMETYFGVAQADALASGYGAYEAGAGLRRLDVSFNAIYALREDWTLIGEVGFGKLIGDAADSPIVLDDVQPNALLALAFRF